MSKLKVIRASAGSGKTYRITAEYLRLLFRYTHNYKHILAVTFTNKATEEMKSRILGELYKLANDKPSDHLKLLMLENKTSEIETRYKARQILNTILHNYSRFSISTIDSFFQRIIKAFAREAGIQFNFDVALDTNEVIERAADQLLLKLENDTTLLEWLVQFAEERIEDGKSWDFKYEILRLGKQLFNEEFKSFPLSFHKKLTQREELKSFHKQLFAIKASFESFMLKSGKAGWQMIQSSGLSVESFKYGKNGSVGQYFLKLSKGDIAEPTKRITEASETVENWLPKDKEEALRVQQLADAGLFNLLNETLKYFNKNYRAYRTGCEVLSVFYTLGILADLSTEVANYAKDNNVFVLAEAGPFLKAIISDNDSPFIYEKTGQVYNHFMIDEFQDTSGIQWFNFKPLVGNALAQQNECLVVGDVKQSIYRWRNSDWKIMASQIDADMNNYEIVHEELEYNWRSKFNIIGFNNTFFNLAPEILQNIYNGNLSESGLAESERANLQTLINLAYFNNAQKTMSKNPNDGFIKIKFINNSNKDWKQQSLESLPEILENLQAKGHPLKDIAILVRTVAEGREVVDYLNLYKQQLPANHNFRYDVLSNESAYLKSSLAITFVINLYKYFVNPNDSVNSAALAHDYCLIKNLPIEKSNVWEPLDVLPLDFKEKIETLKYLPPDELFERIVSIFSLNETIEHLSFIQAFHDFIADFMERHTANFVNLLDYWEEKKNSLSVSVSQNQDAIKVMTIHKSKGLEFATVIVPFCHWNFDHVWPNTPIIWCSPTEGPFNRLEYLPVRYSSHLHETHFNHQYFQEKAKSYVDNLNLLYVAFTRAADNLFLFCQLPEKEDKISTTSELIFKTLKNELKSLNADCPQTNFAKGWNANENTFEYGEITKTEPHADANLTNEIILNKYPGNEIKEKLRQRSIAAGFWDSAEKTSAVFYGNIMHRMFQQIKVFEDIEKAADIVVLEGLIKLDEKEKVIAETKAMLSQSPFNNWFSGNWKVMNEAAIVVPNQHLYRPDRVMVKENMAVVVDYKFGRKKDVLYNVQVKEYSQYLEEMGFQNIESYVWYLKLNELEKVN